MDERPLAAAVPISPAATVMLLRDGTAGVDGLEVFMLQRTMSAAFARGQYVFPGGRVDDADHGTDFEPVCEGLDDAEASRRLGLESGGLAWLLAAIRECFEEAGVLLARTADGEVVRFDDPDLAARLTADRDAVHDGTRSLVEVCVDERLQLLPERLQFVAHWLTPVGERRRFDTRFFLAAAPPSQQPLHDDGETIASVWIRPADALTMWKQGELQMFPPTVACLRMLAGFGSVAEALSGTASIGIPELIEPRLVLSDDERILAIRLPGEDGYEQLEPPRYVIAHPR